MSKDNIRSRNIDYEELNFESSGEDGYTHRFTGDEQRNLIIAILVAILNVLFCLVAMILCWVLYWRERTRTFLWHSIYLIFILLFTLFCVFWAFSSHESVKYRKEPNKTQSLVVYVGCLACMTYLVAEAFWLFYYKSIHFAYLVGLKTNDELWNKRMTNGSTFQEGWVSSKAIIIWVLIFSLVAGFGFGFMAYCSRSVNWNKVLLTRVGLYSSLFFVVFSGFVVIYSAEECFEYQKVTEENFGGEFIARLKWLALASIVLALINSVLNYVKAKSWYFVVGVLWALMFAVVICQDGMLWREVRVGQGKRLTTGCQESLMPIHEKILDKVCVNEGKYLPTERMCTKEFQVMRWENPDPKSQEVRSLNPSCCELGRQSLLIPFMLLAFWSLIMAICILLSMAKNIYLSDISEDLQIMRNPVGVLDYAFIGSIVLVTLAFFLYFGIRKQNSLPEQFNPYTRSFTNPESNIIPGLPLVSSKIIEMSNKTPNMKGCNYYSLSNLVNPVFSETDANCSSHCTHRVAILSRTGYLNAEEFKGAYRGSEKSRLNFMPQCTDSSKSYFFFYGSLDQVREALKTILICPYDLGVEPEVFFYHDQVPDGSVNPDGVTLNESLSLSLAASDGPGCGGGFLADKTCNGKCKVDLSVTGTFMNYSIKGQLYFVDKGQEKTKMHPYLKITASVGTQRIGSKVFLFESGIFIIEGVPRYIDSGYALKLKFEDPKSVFLTKEIEVLVQRNIKQEDELSAGRVRLLTPNGLVCDVADSACIGAQANLSGIINLSVKDGSNDTNLLPLDGVVFTISKGHSSTGESVKSHTSNMAGVTTVAGLFYGSYSITASIPRFRSSVKRIDLQEPFQSISSFVMRPSDDQYDMRVISQMAEPGADFDLNLKIKAENGVECLVSPFNKYCGYSAHLRDVSFGEGEECISIKRLAVANYMAYITPAEPYQGQCQENDVSKEARTHYQLNWNWKNFQSLRPLESLKLSTFLVGNSKSSQKAANEGTPILLKLLPIESRESSLILKKVISVDNTPLDASSQFLRTTAVASAAIRILANNKKIVTHRPDVINNNILAYCFTGFGESSAVQVMKFQVETPSIEQCIPIINNLRPGQTIEKLSLEVAKN